MQIDVVIPTKNRAGFVGGAIRSALDAAEVGDVVVVDDDSQDETRAVLASFGSRIQVVRGEFGSAAAARNAGIRASTAPFVSLLDSDDVMLPAKIPDLMPHFTNPLVSVVHGGIEVIDEHDEFDEVATARHARLLREADRQGTDYAGLARKCLMFSSALIIRRDAFDFVGGYDESLTLPYEDLDLYLRLALVSRLRYAPATVVRYRIWSGNFDATAHANGSIVVAKKHLDLLDRSIADPRTRARARGGLLRRLAQSSRSLMCNRDARRYLVRSFRADPLSLDVQGLRLLVGSLLPRR